MPSREPEPGWTEPDSPWTPLDEARLAARLGPRAVRVHSAYPWHRRARHALLRFVAAPLTVYRLHHAGWRRTGWRKWEPPVT